MKRFLQGLGSGILIAVVILAMTYYVGGYNKISNEQVISKAKKLGMIQPTQAPLFNDETNNQNPDEMQNTDDAAQPDTDEAVQNQNPDETQNTDDAIQPNTDETVQNQNITDGNAENQVYENSNDTNNVMENESSKVNGDGTVSLVITKGEGATVVSEHLSQLGVVSDAADFDNYLRYNNYSHKLQVGTYTLSPGMSYDEIIGIISVK